MRIMDQLSNAHVSSKGKDLAGKPPGVGKKIRLETSSTPASHDPTLKCDDHVSSSHRVLLECAAENNNVLHICCSMATGKADVSVNDQSDFSSVESLCNSVCVCVCVRACVRACVCVCIVTLCVWNL